MGRPTFQAAWNAFVAVRVPVRAVGKLIGGNVQVNIEMPDGFENACAIRMSYVLNKTGFPIRKTSKFRMVSGGDRQQYIYRVDDMLAYLEQHLGRPDKTVHAPRPVAFAKMRGILVVKGHGWSGAQGHATLWDGQQCVDRCHFANDPENGTFVPKTTSLWRLP